MLVQFMMKNFLSFKDETILDMSAIKAYKEHECNLISYPNTKERFLRVAAVYGANASGKSNLYFGLKYFQNIIQESMNHVGEDALTALEEYYVPFSFDSDENPTEFQMIFMYDGFEYKYGFEYNESCILSEWLYRRNLVTNRNSIILERNRDEIDFGASVRKECDSYKTQIPKESLALSLLSKLILENTVFSNVYREITDILVTSTDRYEDRGVLKRLLPAVIDRAGEQLIEFLNAIDSGILNIGYDENDGEIQLYTKHRGENGQDYILPLFNESQGTIKSIALFICARSAVLNNKIIVIDELNAKLHPLLLKFIIDLFYETQSTAQLIYTTHDTTLMDKKFFRRDQIWFVQKDEYGHSELVALSDYKVRSDASFEKDYLANVYGGIPMLKEFSLKGEE